MNLHQQTHTHTQIGSHTHIRINSEIKCVNSDLELFNRLYILHMCVLNR